MKRSTRDDKPKSYPSRHLALAEVGKFLREHGNFEKAVQFESADRKQRQLAKEQRQNEIKYRMDEAESILEQRSHQLDVENGYIPYERDVEVFIDHAQETGTYGPTMIRMLHEIEQSGVDDLWSLTVRETAEQHENYFLSNGDFEALKQAARNLIAMKRLRSTNGAAIQEAADAAERARKYVAGLELELEEVEAENADTDSEDD